METLTATDARKSFFDILKQANQQHEVFEIQYKAGNAVIMSASEYENLQETLELLSDSTFKQGFEKGVAEAEEGELVSFEDVFGEPQ